MIQAVDSPSPRRIKLRPPRLPEDVVVRPRLLARLNRMAALSLIVAPAGYGKTTLVGSWLLQTAMPFAWLALDDSDNDPAMFLAGLATALATIYAGFGADILASLAAPQSTPFVDLAMRLISLINERGDEFILVLDDYHAIRQPQIHQLLVDLVAYPPCGMHLVITSRHDPPLPWRMRNRSNACELRAGDLSFTVDEAAQFLTKASDRPVTAADAQAYVQLAQGWITSLRIKALGMRLHTATNRRSEAPGAGVHDFSDYFEREVLADLAPEMGTFLERTSILELLSGPLCDAVTGVGGGSAPRTERAPGRSSAELLQDLVTIGAFTEAMDDNGTWYRYHPLLRDVLRRRLTQSVSAEEIGSLYVRASAWYEDHDLLDEALTSALAGAQIERAVDFVRRHRQQLLDRWDWGRIERWLQMFPPGAVANHIELLLARAWTNQWSFNTAEIHSDLERIEVLVTELPPGTAHLTEWRGEIASLRSQRYVSQGDAGKAIAAAQVALTNLPSTRVYVRTIAMVGLAFGYQMAGEWERALACIAEQTAAIAGPRELTMGISLALRAYIDLPMTNLPPMRSGYVTLAQITAARGLKTNLAWAHYFWAATSYLQNDLHGAEEHFRAVVESVDNAHAVSYTHSAIGLALTYQAQGRDQEAAAVIESAQKRLAARQQHHVLEWAEAFAAELAARQGRIGEALRWVASKGRRHEYDATPLFYVPGLAAVKVLLAGGSAGNLLAARYWLEQQMDLAQRTHNSHAQVQCYALEAALYEAQGERPKARDALAAALAMAEYGQIVRVFVDLAVQLTPLFEELAADQSLSAFAVRVYNALMLESRAPASSESAVRSHSANSATVALTASAEDDPHLADARNGSGRDLHELLTYREMDVLRLLDQRLTNKEIAHALSISTETVRQHTVNLFRKLKVDNRRHAIVAARDMGYFDERR